MWVWCFWRPPDLGDELYDLDEDVEGHVAGNHAAGAFREQGGDDGAQAAAGGRAALESLCSPRPQHPPTSPAAPQNQYCQQHAHLCVAVLLSHLIRTQ